jgi:hypothetical protein
VLRDSGVAYTYRIPMEDVASADEVEAHSERFSERLAER